VTRTVSPWGPWLPRRGRGPQGLFGAASGGGASFTIPGAYCAVEYSGRGGASAAEAAMPRDEPEAGLYMTVAAGGVMRGEASGSRAGSLTA
jgi:hypothetical protein